MEAIISRAASDRRSWLSLEPIGRLLVERHIARAPIRPIPAGDSSAWNQASGLVYCADVFFSPSPTSVTSAQHMGLSLGRSSSKSLGYCGWKTRKER